MPCIRELLFLATLLLARVDLRVVDKVRLLLVVLKVLRQECLLEVVVRLRPVLEDPLRVVELMELQIL
jgi:hypothetical protein